MTDNSTIVPEMATTYGGGRFIGCDGGYADSRIVLFGAPFDGTASYRPGARFACAAVRGESYSIETYSPYLDMDLTTDLAERPVFDGGDLELPFGNPARTLELIEAYADAALRDGKLPLMLGGEHLVTLGVVRAAARARPGLAVVQFDAHADLRDEYLGERLSHATVLRRCHELTGDGRIFQFGIRSGERAEFQFAREHTRMRRFGFEGLDESLAGLRGQPVYLTIDLDVLDPSEFPGTGTPEAGGVRFRELLRAAELVIGGCDVVGLDITELSPPLDPSGISVSLACKLLRELILLLSRPK